LWLDQRKETELGPEDDRKKGPLPRTRDVTSWESFFDIPIGSVKDCMGEKAKLENNHKAKKKGGVRGKGTQKNGGGSWINRRNF